MRTGKEPGGRVPALDGLRAFAISGVVLIHLFGISGVLVAGDGSFHDRAIFTVFGNTLDIFFIVSGFGLFLPIVRSKGRLPRTGDFLLKRFARLQPEYWLCLVVILALMAFVPIDFGSPFPSPMVILIHFLDLQKAVQLLDPDFVVGLFIGGGALWLVPVIAGLYLIFPLLARMMLWSIPAAVVTAALITFAWKVAPDHLPGLFQALSGHQTTDDNIRLIAADQTPAYIYSFALGMAGAWIYNLAETNRDSPWLGRGVLLAFAIGLPVYVLLSFNYTDAALTSVNGIDAASRGRTLALNGLAASTTRVILILALILGPMWLQRPFAGRTAHWVADQSYGIYLIHLPVAFLVLSYIAPPQNGTFKAFATWLAIVLPVATAYAWCSRRFVGLPASRAMNVRLQRRRSAG